MKKKLFIPALIIFVSSFSSPVFASMSKNELASSELSSVVELKDEKNTAQLLLKRLHDISSLKKENLSSAEKTALKKEVIGIKHQLAEINGGIYLSAGVIILIIILIIIL